MTLHRLSAPLRALAFVAALSGAALAAAQPAAGAASGGAPAASGAASTAVPTENDPVVHAREFALSSQLRCLVCQNQTIAESNAGLAVDLRNQVREQIAAGRSDREIIDFMTTRYGDFVLYRPPLKGTTALLWFGPLLLAIVGAVVALVVVRRRRALTERALTDEERRRAAALLAQGERP